LISGLKIIDTPNLTLLKTTSTEETHGTDLTAFGRTPAYPQHHLAERQH
jgi:hypothetical protein